MIVIQPIKCGYMRITIGCASGRSDVFYNDLKQQVQYRIYNLIPSNKEKSDPFLNTNIFISKCFASKNSLRKKYKADFHFKDCRICLAFLWGVECRIKLRVSRGQFSIRCPICLFCFVFFDYCLFLHCFASL